jgi:hypothetical protein
MWATRGGSAAPALYLYLHLHLHLAPGTRTASASNRRTGHASGFAAAKTAQSALKEQYNTGTHTREVVMCMATAKVVPEKPRPLFKLKYKKKGGGGGVNN